MQYIDNPDRALVTEMLRMDEYIDVIIPRGGAGLHRLCKEQSTIPVITGGIGICHVYVDETADLDRAVDIVENAKSAAAQCVQCTRHSAGASFDGAGVSPSDG